MSNLVMARIKPLNGPLLAAAEQHGRRLDSAAIRRKVRDEPSLTWMPDSIDGDPLALSDRLADHVVGAMVPKAKAKALHMLVKLPASVPVETDADARAALALVVQFAQDTYGGQAVFSARMDRDERSLNSVDVFMAPRYEKVTKRARKSAISLTRFGKILAVKHGIEDRSDSARGSMQAQGSALQDELATWLTDRGFEARRGVAKDRDGDDWKTPEVMGARKDRAAIEALIAEQLPEVMEARAEADRLLADARRVADEAIVAAKQTRRYAETAAHAAAASLRMQAESDAARIRHDATADAELLAAAAIKDRQAAEEALRQADSICADQMEQLVGRERKLQAEEATLKRETARLAAKDVAVGTDRAAADAATQKALLRDAALDRREVSISEREMRVGQQADLLGDLVRRLEPMLAAVQRAHSRLATAPEHVRRWFDPDRQVATVVETTGSLVEQARKAVRALALGKGPRPLEEDPVDLAIQKAALDGRTGRNGE